MITIPTPSEVSEEIHHIHEVEILECRRFGFLNRRTLPENVPLLGELGPLGVDEIVNGLRSQFGVNLERMEVGQASVNQLIRMVRERSLPTEDELKDYLVDLEAQCNTEEDPYSPGRYFQEQEAGIVASDLNCEFWVPFEAADLKGIDDMDGLARMVLGKLRRELESPLRV